jgi:GNAT acetyltransferase-like protein
VSESHEAYDAFAAASPQGTVFCSSWWLDATAGSGRWRHTDVCDADGRLIATWPAAVRRTRFGDVLTGAPLTPHLGPLLSAGDGRQRRSREVDQLERLADALRPYAHVEACCSPRLDYWTPLSWHGFSQTTHYTWRLEDVSDEEATFARLRDSARRQVSKAQRLGLVVEPGTVDDLVALQRQTFERQEEAGTGPQEALVRRLAAAVTSHGAGEILVARDDAGQVHSASMFVHDERTTWYLLGGSDTELRASGSASLLMWEGIRRAGVRGTAFDFEGSMLRHVERFVRNFGGEPTAYSIVRHTPSLQWRCRTAGGRLARRALSRKSR